MTSTLPAPPAAASPVDGGRAVSGLCRLTFRAPRRSVELAVPVDVPVAELLPTVLELAGAEVAEQGLAHDGWVLQRLGGAPLDLDATVGRHDLLDGDVLHLRRHTEALPPAAFDDLVEGVAEGMMAATPSWSVRATRVALVATVVVALLGGLVALGLPGQHVTRAATAGFAGLLLLGAALSAAQAVGDRAIGSVLGVGGVAYIALAGALVVGGGDPTGPRLLAAGMAALAASALATAAVAWAPPFTTTGIVALAAAAGGGAILAGSDLGGVAALAVLLALVVGHFAPPIAFRFAGLKLPALPGNAAQLQEDIDPHPADEVAARSRAAAVLLDTTSAGCGAVLSVALGVLAFDGSWTGWSLCLVVSVLLLAHQRAFTAAVVRASAVVPGVVGLTMYGLHLATDLSGTHRVAVGVGAVLIAVAVSVAAASVPGRRVLPYWGSIADLVQTLTAIATLPFVALVLGVYSWLRGMSG